MRTVVDWHCRVVAVLGYCRVVVGLEGDCKTVAGVVVGHRIVVEVLDVELLLIVVEHCRIAVDILERDIVVVLGLCKAALGRRRLEVAAVVLVDKLVFVHAGLGKPVVAGLSVGRIEMVLHDRILVQPEVLHGFPELEID